MTMMLKCDECGVTVPIGGSWDRPPNFVRVNLGGGSWKDLCENCQDADELTNLHIDRGTA